MATHDPTRARRIAALGIRALNIAIARLGKQTVFAKRLGVSDQVVSHWRHRDLLVPLEHVAFVVQLAQDPAVTPYTLRPDYAEGWALLAHQLSAVSLKTDEPEEVTA
jgi:DNA-binding transcriptional regulator YdaS (Cro superfamily)